MALVYDPRTGKLVDDGTGVPGNPARAAAMQAQYNQPVTGPRSVVPLVQPPVLAGMGTVDRGPARSLPAPTGDNPTLAAAMQAQYNQPVTGPRGLVTPGQPITPFFNVQQLPDYGNPGAVPYAQRQAEYAQRNPAPVAPVAPPTYPDVPEFNTPVTAPAAAPVTAPAAAPSARNPNAINVGGALGQAYLGSMAAVPATALDALRRGVTNLAGGDVNTLPGGQAFYSDQAFGAIDQGLGNFAQANRDLGSAIGRGVRGLLGVQEAQAPAAMAAPAPTVPRAAAPAPAPATPAPAPYNAYEDPNHPINRTPQGVSASASVSTRGNYNAQNTDLGALAQRAAPTNGINFGFGVGGAETAQQYLARMQTVDQQRAAQRQQTGLMNEARWARHTLANNPSVGEMAAARAQLAALNPQINTLMQNQGGLAQMGLRNQGDLATTGLQNEGLLQRAAMDADARAQAAAITGQYGLREAALKAEADQLELALESMTPTARKASAEAALLETRLNAIRDEVQAGGLNNLGVVAATRSGQERDPVPIIDPITGVPYTADEIAMIQARRTREEQARQQR